MKKFLLFFSFAFLTWSAQAQDLQWAKSLGGTDQDEGFAITTDAAGNVYTTGWFSGTADFDPGPGVSNLTANSFFDVFVSKMDAAGNLVWAKAVGGIENDAGRTIAVDASGNVYVCGDFGTAVDFDPGPGVYELTTSGAVGYFALKLDANGNFIWARAVDDAPGYAGSRANSAALDADGNLIITGPFNGTADFDPGPATANLSNLGASDAFIVKMDPAGNLLWAKQLSGTRTTEATGLCIDPVGNISLVGYYNGEVDLDPGDGNASFAAPASSNSYNIFTVKLNSSGNFLWAKSFDESTSSNQRFSIATDGAGNVYTTGQYRGTVDFDPGAGVVSLSSTGNGNIFITKLNAAGSFVWAKSLGGSSPFPGDVGRSIASDAYGNVYTTGSFYGRADFDPGSGTFNVSSTGSSTTSDAFILQLDAAGNFAYAKNMGGALDDQGNALSVDAAGNIYCTGFFNGTADFDPGNAVFNLVTAGKQDAFILKLGASPLALNLLEFNGRWANGSSVVSWKTDQEKNLAGFEVERSIDGRHYNKVGALLATNSGGVHGYSFTDADIRGLAANVIYYRLKQKDLNGGAVFSRIIALALHGKNSLLFYPNPVKTSAGLAITLDKATTVMASVTDNSGRLVQQQQWNLPAGSSSLSLDISRLSRGTYQLSLAGATIRETRKFNKE